MLLQSSNPQNPPKNKKKMEKALKSLKQLPRGHKKQQFYFLENQKLIWQRKGNNTFKNKNEFCVYLQIMLRDCCNRKSCS